MPREIGKLADELLRDPVKVAVAPVATTVERVTQRVIHVESHNKRALLVELFADPQMSRTLVFTRTKRGADRVARHLEAAGIRVAAIHGNKSQRQREQALAAFRASKIRVLVATDIAARGIDIDHVTHVVNYELPEVPESLRPPHRPHGARRRRGHRHLALRRRGARPAARHRAPDAAVDPRRGSTVAYEQAARENAASRADAAQWQWPSPTAWREDARPCSVLVSGPLRHATATPRKQGAGRNGLALGRNRRGIDS